MRTRVPVLAALAVALTGTAVAQASTGWQTVSTPQPGPDYAYQSRWLTGVVAFGTKDVWVAGSYNSTKSGPATPLVLRWTGTGWDRAALPTVAGGADIRFLAASGRSNIWAVGNGGTQGPNIVLFRYDGTSWHRASASGLPSSFEVESAATAGTDNVWLGGYELGGTPNPVLEHWNGSAWSQTLLPLPAGAVGQVSGLSFVPGAADPTAVGYTVSSNVFHPYAARHTAGGWSYQSAAATAGEFRSVVMVSANNGWAVGTRYPTSSSYETLLGHWNGASWSTMKGRDRTGWNTLLSVSADAPGNVWGVGYSQRCSSCQYRTLAEHWNGSTWAIAATGDPSTSGTDQFFADAVVPGTNQVWAVGTYGPARPANLAEYFLAERDN